MANFRVASVRLTALCVCALLLHGLAATRAHAQGAFAYQPVIGTFPSGVMLNVTPVVTADRRYVRFVNLNPQFTTLTEFNNFVIPGAVRGGFGGFGGGGGGGFGGFGFGGGGGGGGIGFNSVPTGALGPGMTPNGYAPGMMQDGFASAYSHAVESQMPSFDAPPARTTRPRAANTSRGRAKRRTR